MNIHSLKLKFIVILIIIFSGVLLLQTFYFVPNIADREQQEAYEIQQDVAKQLSATFELSFQQTIAEVEAIATLPAIKNLDVKNIDRILNEMDLVTQFFNYYFISDLESKWISYPSKPFLVGKKIGADYWIKDVIEKNATTFIDVHLATNINTIVSGFATPILSDAGEKVAILRGVITVSDKNSLLEQIKKIRIGTTGYVYIVDSIGQLLVHPEISISPESLNQYDYTAYAPVSKALLGESGVIEYSYNDQPWIAAYQPIPTTGWALVVQQPKSNIEQHVKEELNEFMNFFLLALLMIALCMVLFFVYALNPLTRLLKKIRSGQPIKVHSFPKDEIGTLAQEFTKYSEHLEEKVANRTEKLLNVNEEMKKEIAERIKAEKNLLKRESTINSILRAAPVGIGLVHNRVFSWISDQVLQISGYERNELIGKSSQVVYPNQEEFDRVGRIKYGQLDQGKDIGEIDTVWLKKDGTLIDVHLRSTPINPTNLSEGVTFSVLDITDRKRMEQDLQRSHKLESLGILAGGIAHDFNNLLQSIVGNISLAKMYVNEDDKVYDKLTETEKAASHATTLTHQLLTFAKGGAPIKKTTHIGSLIKNSASFSLQGSNVSCKYIIADDLLPVDVDEGQINQVIQNLVINANHAMPSGGIITIHAENCLISLKDLLPIDAGQYVKITVQDEGIGIPAEHVPRVFDPYYSTKQSGSGLGLAVAYSVIKSHSGLMTVESEAGHGAMFHIYLPASESELAGTEDTAKKPAIHTAKGRVLVMDDEERVREVVVEMLELLGYEVTTAVDGNEALAQYQAAMFDKPFDFVILDLTVPGGIGGEEAIMKLLEINPDIKAFVSSGYANDPIMADYERYGFCGVISKPYTIGNLSSLLNSHMESTEEP